MWPQAWRKKRPHVSQGGRAWWRALGRIHGPLKEPRRTLRGPTNQWAEEDSLVFPRPPTPRWVPGIYRDRRVRLCSDIELERERDRFLGDLSRLLR
ncbi:hypothetical protein PUN28_014008 [Cardiocondyla obscurior]|uniref:Uncharacterized protein n=1 Tax=Cardiocondyla obscurior TaxID=286306 RepID=A0AAW2F6P8_9HYME